MLVRCINCGFPCQKYGKTSAGTQRWYCTACHISFVNKIDNTTKQLKEFLTWLFSKTTQQELLGKGRTFRRNTAKFWDIWPMPPKVEERRDIVFVDGIYLARKACVLICYDGIHVLGWYVCRYEYARAWEALLRRITSPTVVISDGGPGFRKAMRKVWPSTKLQRCTFHAFCQVRRYTTTRPKTLAGIVLYQLAKDLMHIHNDEEARAWILRLSQWEITFKDFLNEMTKDDQGNTRPTHERLLKGYYSLVRLVTTKTLFTYLDEKVVPSHPCPATNNPIEGGVNAQLRALIRNHRGLSIDRRIKAVFWWCYMHSPKPLSATEILKVMPTDTSISKIYKNMNEKKQLEGILPTWGDAIVWGDLHNYDKSFSTNWD